MLCCSVRHVCYFREVQMTLTKFRIKCRRNRGEISHLRPLRVKNVVSTQANAWPDSASKPSGIPTTSTSIIPRDQWICLELMCASLAHCHIHVYNTDMNVYIYGYLGSLLINYGWIENFRNCIISLSQIYLKCKQISTQSFKLIYNTLN